MNKCSSNTTNVTIDDNAKVLSDFYLSVRMNFKFISIALVTLLFQDGNITFS